MIVRITDSGVLGGGVHSARAAGALLESLKSREGWAGIDAVRHGRILLLSEEMLATPWLRTAAMVLIARTADPALVEDVDPEEMLRMLSEEATGTLPGGILYYGGNQP